MDLLETQRLAKTLMLENGLTEPKWRFQFDNSVRCFGVCKQKIRRVNGVKEYYSGVISLSRKLVLINDLEQVRDTILHEIAHALTPGHGHDAVWKAKCVEIGAKPERCYSEKDTNTLKETAKYKATCGACGKEFTKHRMAKREIQISCRCQSGKSWDSRVLLTFVDTRK